MDRAAYRGDTIFFGDSAIYVFHCNYLTSASTKTTRFETNHFPHSKKLEQLNQKNELEHFVTWDSAIDITFFDSNSFQFPNEMNAFYLGTRLFFEIAWTETVTEDFPIEFYTDVCTVSDNISQMSFSIIKSGCGASIIETELMSDSPYQSNEIRWAFRSFQFTNNLESDMRIDCNVNFVLKETRIIHYNPYNKKCPAGYLPPKSSS